MKVRLGWFWLALLGCSEERAQAELEDAGGCPSAVLSGDTLGRVIEGLGLAGSAYLPSVELMFGKPEQLAVASRFGQLAPPAPADCLLILSTGLPLAPSTGPWRWDHAARPGEREFVTLLLELSEDRPEAHGFSFDLLFVAADWPEAVCYERRDRSRVAMEVWADSREEGYYLIELGGPRDLDITNEHFLPAEEGGEALRGTPYGEETVDTCGEIAALSCEVPPDLCPSETVPPVGGRTGWLRAQGPLPRGPVRLLFDLYEGLSPSDTVLLLANFRFLQESPEPALLELSDLSADARE